MKIGILGSGTVAKSLGQGFLKHDYQVKLGTRTPSKLAEWQGEWPEGSVGTFEEAASFGELLVLAVKGKHSLDVLGATNKRDLEGKIIIDTGNPIDDDSAPEDGVLKFYTDQNGSLMEELQSAYPNARFVKAFNSVGAHLMVNPQFEAGKPTMFIAGNEESAKEDVTKILDQFGWETKDMGSAKAARAIEPLCMLWCIPGFRENQWNMAFKWLTK